VDEHVKLAIRPMISQTPRQQRYARRSAAPRLCSLAVVAALVVLTGCGHTRSPAPAASPPPSPSPPGQAAIITRVVDGDTYHAVVNGQPVIIRALGVDTPETQGAYKAHPQCWGLLASRYARETLTGKTVLVEADPGADQQDRFGRLLRYVWVGDRLFNRDLVDQGYARAYTRFRYTRRGEFVALEEHAWADRRGMWGACTVTP
jgi:micrococcal nuclease